MCCCRIFPTRLYLRLLYRLKIGKKLHLKNPQSFSEKIQWLKIYDRNPMYIKMVDKIQAKNFVSERIGCEYIIPTISVWDRVEEIDWKSLPNSFVLKTTHGGGSRGVVICKDKQCFDYRAAIEKIQYALKQDIWNKLREWPYKGVKPRVFAEQYIKPNLIESSLTDYKWYCFNGEPHYCQVIKNRTGEETIDYFDLKWHHQDFIGLNPLAKNAMIEPACPDNLETQIYIARKLSKGTVFSRIDLYEVEGHVYFGEITFYPRSGLGVFRPYIWNYRLGDLIDLPI